MAIYGFVGLCRVCRAMYGEELRCRAMYGYLGLCGAM